MSVVREGAPIDGRYNAWCGCCQLVAIGTAGALLKAGWTPSTGGSWWYCPDHMPSPVPREEMPEPFNSYDRARAVFAEIEADLFGGDGQLELAA